MTTASSDASDEVSLRTLERMPRVAAVATLVLGILAGGFAFLVLTPRVGVSVALGAGVGGLNFWGLAWILRGFFAANAGTKPLLLLAPVKLVILFGGIYLLVTFGIADILPLLVGYALLPIGIAVAQLAPESALKKG